MEILQKDFDVLVHMSEEEKEVRKQSSIARRLKSHPRRSTVAPVSFDSCREQHPLYISTQHMHLVNIESSRFAMFSALLVRELLLKQSNSERSGRVMMSLCDIDDEVSALVPSECAGAFKRVQSTYDDSKDGVNWYEQEWCAVRVGLDPIPPGAYSNLDDRFSRILGDTTSPRNTLRL